MTPVEFRAWLDGFAEAVEGAPTPEQWAKVKAKLAEVKGPAALPAVLKEWPGITPCTTIPGWPPSVTSTTIGALTDALPQN